MKVLTEITALSARIGARQDRIIRLMIEDEEKGLGSE
jgi:hypothetical protein